VDHHIKEYFESKEGRDIATAIVDYHMGMDKGECLVRGWKPRPNPY